MLRGVEFVVFVVAMFAIGLTLRRCAAAFM